MEPQRKEILGWEAHKDKRFRAMFWCYDELYERAGSDFKDLIRMSPIVDDRVTIPFDMYEVTQKDFDEVFDGAKNKFRLNPLQFKQVKFEVELGASPKTKPE